MGFCPKLLVFCWPKGLTSGTSLPDIVPGCLVMGWLDSHLLGFSAMANYIFLEQRIDFVGPIMPLAF